MEGKTNYSVCRPLFFKEKIWNSGYTWAWRQHSWTFLLSELIFLFKFIWIVIKRTLMNTNSASMLLEKILYIDADTHILRIVCHLVDCPCWPSVQLWVERTESHRRGLWDLIFQRNWSWRTAEWQCHSPVTPPNNKSTSNKTIGSLPITNTIWTADI